MTEDDQRKKIEELEMKLKQVDAHSKALEKQTRESFSRLMEVISRFTSATNRISETVVKDLEDRFKLPSEWNVPQEIIDKLEEIERKFDDFEQEMEDKVHEITDQTFREAADSQSGLIKSQGDLIKISQKHFELIKENREAINGILRYIKERDKVTVTKVLLTLSSLRTLLGSP